MDISLTINSNEIREYIAEDGISVSTEERVAKTVTTLDGTEYTHYVTKYKLDISLLDNLIGSKFTILKSYLATNPAAVTFSNFETGLTFSGTFYIKDLKYQLKKSYGGDAILSGVSFSLIER